MWIASLALFLITCPAQRIDTDGDGLSDFQERHKYRTDPGRADSDGDGMPDGDWAERREFTYSVRSLVQVLAPYDLDTIVNDDYQDARVLDERDGYVELEVIHYPFNGNAESIEGRRGWRDASAKMEAYLRPGKTTNWDADMRAQLLEQLAAEGIDPYALTDAEAVEAVAGWALERCPSLGKTAVFTIVFDDGEPGVHPSLRTKFENNKGAADWSDAEHFERELYGKGMFEHGSRGTCTTSANYLTTVLRAVGIPTRMIVTIPVVDASDPANRELVERITHNGVRREIEVSVEQRGSSFAAHTYNEVYVDGRWRRLNYGKLGQNTLDRDYMGLMTHVHTYDDLAEAGLGEGWGVRHPNRHPSPVFRHNNPYTTLTLSDQFGEHCDLPNPETPDANYRVLTISRIYWFLSDAERPAMIGADWSRVRDSRSGHLLVHVDECDPDRGSGQYREFFERVGKDFILRSPGRPDVFARSEHAWWTDCKLGVAEFYLNIAPDQFARMEAGHSYELVPVDAGPVRWRVAEGLSIERR